VENEVKTESILRWQTACDHVTYKRGNEVKSGPKLYQSGNLCQTGGGGGVQEANWSCCRCGTQQ